MSDESFKSGDKVYWNWGQGHPKGKVDNVVPDQDEIESKGKTITKKGTEDNPAVEITTNKGVPVLKKASELHKDEGSNK